MTDKGKVPEVGDKAPVIDTPTVASAGGDIKKIDTRLPPSSLHAKNFRDVVGKKPVVLLFATPALCQTRVCGPVVDVAEEVKAERGKDAEFIQMEIFRDNDIKKGYRPQVRDVQPAHRAVGVRHRQERQGGRPDRGPLQRRRARARRGRRHEELARADLEPGQRRPGRTT